MNKISENWFNVGLSKFKDLVENVMFVVACLFMVYALYLAYVLFRMYMGFRRLATEDKVIRDKRASKISNCTYSGDHNTKNIPSSFSEYVKQQRFDGNTCREFDEKVEECQTAWRNYNNFLNKKNNTNTPYNGSFCIRKHYPMNRIQMKHKLEEIVHCFVTKIIQCIQQIGLQIIEHSLLRMPKNNVNKIIYKELQLEQLKKKKIHLEDMLG